MEKILESGEELPKTWPVAGTTGYDAMREVNGVFIDHDHEPEFTALYEGLTGDQRTIGDHIEAGKRLAVNTLLPAEVRGMAALAPEIPMRGRHFPRWRLHSRFTARICRKALLILIMPLRRPRGGGPTWPAPLINSVLDSMIMVTTWRCACSS